MNSLAKSEVVEMVPQEAAITPMSLLQLAMSQNADLDKLTKLMELQERWEANEARKAFNAAMAQFKANPPHISKNKHVKFGQTEYDHATLDHVSEVIGDALSKVGIRHSWATVQDDSGMVHVTCVLSHELGHSERTTLRANADTSGSKNAIQALGSAVTYLQRYTLLAATGMATGLDDDGQNAGMPDQTFVDLLTPIENAHTEPELQHAFAKAYKAAKEMNDSSAMRQFVEKKDLRKAELRASR